LGDCHQALEEWRWQNHHRLCRRCRNRTIHQPSGLKKRNDLCSL
ncbi:MAG: transposase, partial [Alistipes sp.]|nr:transposase [Alistipes sp.]